MAEKKAKKKILPFKRNFEYNPPPATPAPPPPPPAGKSRTEGLWLPGNARVSGTARAAQAGDVPDQGLGNGLPEHRNSRSKDMAEQKPRRVLQPWKKDWGYKPPPERPPNPPKPPVEPRGNWGGR